MNNSVLQAELVSLPNDCRRAVPYPEVHHLLWDPPPPATHLAQTHTPRKCSRAQRRTKYRGRSLTSRWVTHNEAPRRALTAHQDIETDAHTCTQRQQPTHDLSTECTEHSWRWYVPTCQWWKPKINVTREQAVEWRAKERRSDDKQTQTEENLNTLLLTVSLDHL